MTMLQRIGQLAKQQDISQGAKNFAHVARYIAMGKGSFDTAVELSERGRAPPRIRDALKAAAAAGSTSGWGSPLAPYTLLADAFLASLSSATAFDRMLPAMPKVPLRTQISVVSGGATSVSVIEANVKVASKLSLTAGQVADHKTVAIVAITEELMRDASNGLFAAELTRAVAAAIDSAFITRLTNGLSPITSNGGTAIAIRQDLAAALAAIDGDTSSQYFVIVDPDTAKAWATKTTSTGEAAFPEMTPNGGQACGVDVVVSDGANGMIVVADASQIAAASLTIELDASNHASMQMDSAPDSPPTASTTLVSFWQMNWLGIRATRHWGAERLRDTACALVTGVSYSGNSPT